MRNRYFRYGMYVCIAVVMSGHWASAQTVCFDTVRARVERLLQADSAYLSEIDLSAGKMSLGEVFRNIAKINGVNLCVKVDEGEVVTCNFDRVRVSDLILFLCREYQLEVEVVGNILSVRKPDPVPLPPVVPRVSVDSSGKYLAYDLSEDNLVAVVKRIACLTRANIIVPQVLYSSRVSGYTAGLPVDEAIETLAASNHLEIRREKSGGWVLLPVAGEKGGQAAVASWVRRRNYRTDQVDVDSMGRITVALEQANVQDIVSEICERLKLNRTFLVPLNQQVSVYVRQTDFNSLLNILFAGTAYTYQYENGVYIFAASGRENAFRMTKIVAMYHRTVDRVVDLIPASMKAGMEIQLFAEQNSVIVSGSSRQVQQVESFLHSIDVSIPLITIEVMIVNSRKSVTQEVGITAGLGGGPEKTHGTISPGINMSLSSASINKLINSLNGFGSINLGKVTPEFYMNLQALEQAGNIEMRSTPKLSTLNGHEALLKSGEKKYYKEVQNNYYGTQNPIPTESYTWKDTEANLSLKMVPFVSPEGRITLTIEIEQSEFTAREEKDAPPGTATRSFKSQVKVSDGEMVLLGGIDLNTKEKSSSGLPFLARIPVLKWIFGSTKKIAVDEKLNVFIKPCVVY